MIRFACASDIGRLVEICHNFHRSSIYANRVKFNPGALAESLATFISSDMGVVMVAERKGDVVGVIGGIVGPHFVSGERAASELFWWVEPEYRGAGLGLLRAYEDEVAERGAKASGMISPIGSGDVEKLYSRCGYAPLETLYYKDLT